MRIRLTSDMSGTRDGQEWPPAGSVVDLPDVEARGLLAGGSAVEENTDMPKVMVPPAGVHVPGRTAYEALKVTHLVEAPADAVLDPEGARQAVRDAAEGNVMEVPVGTGVQARDGSALPRDEVDRSVEAEKTAQEDRVRTTAPTVGVDKPAVSVRGSDKPVDKSADKPADKTVVDKR
jgi:hypothetical protein